MQNFQKGLVYPTFYPSFYPMVLFISKHGNMMTLENYDYEYLKSLSPRELSNFYKTEMKSNREINKIFEKFVNDFIAQECPPGDSLFLMGSEIQVPPNMIFIEVRPYQGDYNYIWRQVICNNKNKSVSLGDWYGMSADEFQSALFFGMTKCSGDVYGPIKELRRCTQSEIANSDMLDYIQEADESEDKIFYLNNDGQESVNENKQKKARNKYMKLTQRDIQYIMNEARNIVAEKRGVMNEQSGATSGSTSASTNDSTAGKNVLTPSTNAKAKAEMDTAKNVAKMMGLKRNQPKQSSGYSPKFHPTQKE